MRLLVTGARGLLGAAIVREFAAAGWEVAARHRDTLDITDSEAVGRQVAAARPDLAAPVKALALQYARLRFGPAANAADVASLERDVRRLSV